MGSFVWDNPCYMQYHNGRPLSSALIEPCQCQNEVGSCVQSSDFMVQYRPRSQSSGRRIKRESYRIYHPNVQYASFCYAPPLQQRFIDYGASRNCCAAPLQQSFIDYGASRNCCVENFETQIFEEERCRPTYKCVRYVRSPSPIIRQVKVRSRPSSCVDFRRKEDNQWTKVVEERHDERYDYHYTLPVEQSVPIFRSSTRDVATETDAIPKKPIRPLSISETQVLDRYETEEKVQRDATAETRTITFMTTAERPLYSSYAAIEDVHDGGYDSEEKHYKKVNSKVQRKEFVERMNVRNGSAMKSFNSFNTYSDLGKNNQVIVRQTTKPREAIVDSASILIPSDESRSGTPLNYENKFRSRSYYQSS